MLLVLEAALGTLIPMHAFAPNLMLPIVIYLGVSPEVQIVRGALISFLLGYLLDSFCGNPMGLQTFVLAASFMVARGAGLRLFPQGLVLPDAAHLLDGDRLSAPRCWRCARSSSSRKSR